MLGAVFVGVWFGIMVLIASPHLAPLPRLLFGLSASSVVWCLTWVVFRLTETSGTVLWQPRIKPGDSVEFVGAPSTGVGSREKGLVIDTAETHRGKPFAVTVRWERSGVIPVLSYEVDVTVPVARGEGSG